MGLPEQMRPATKSGRFSLLAQQILQGQQKTAEIYRGRLFRVSEASVALGLHPSTVRAYIKAGELRAVRVGAFGHWKVPFSEVQRLRGENDAQK